MPLLLLLIFLFLSSTTSTTLSNSPQFTNNKHFVLVHGACHGAWSWYKVSTLLKSSGHTVTALDMDASGIDTRQPKTVSSLAEYFQPLTKFMEALPLEERVVLIGHSFGGLGIAKAMEDFPEKISVAVFVTAAMPGPNLNISIIGIEDLTLASVLVRPHGLSAGKDPKKEFVFTKERYGSVKRAFIVSEKDLMATRNFQLWMIENNPPDIYVEIKGSDHMVMASKPDDLSNQLQLLAHQFSHLSLTS